MQDKITIKNDSWDLDSLEKILKEYDLSIYNDVGEYIGDKNVLALIVTNWNRFKD